MYPDIDTLSKLLLKEHFISPDDVEAAKAGAKNPEDFIKYFLANELLSKELLGQALAEYYKLPYADMSRLDVLKEIRLLVPESLASSMRVAVFKHDDKHVIIATDSPKKADLGQLKKVFDGRGTALAYTLPEYIDSALDLYRLPLSERLTKIMATSGHVAPDILNETIREAKLLGASDIHYEPTSTDVLVRFRIDGTLREVARLERSYFDNILNRIKVESGMRIDEHLVSQDGSMQRELGDGQLDLRVSLVPTVEGEKIVMRLLGSYIAGLSVADIGFGKAHRALIGRIAERPFGMILVVGPTGSGKTTTLYSLIKLLNKPGVNVTTIEDPVEYKIAGINQIQVREQSNMTFARGLRSIVRQDPDVILVGEIRDRETAEIAVNAALTGHLLLSSFHSNDAATAIPRLQDMGVEPFLLASTLEAIIAQRLLRRLCVHCRYSVPAGQVVASYSKKGLKVAKYFTRSESLYAGKGCAACGGTGYKGRLPVFEIIEVTADMQELMMHSPSTSQIEAEARKHGDQSMLMDGIEKVKLGETSLEELLRVVPLRAGS